MRDLAAPPPKKWRREAGIIKNSEKQKQVDRGHSHLLKDQVVESRKNSVRPLNTK